MALGAVTLPDHVALPVKAGEQPAVFHSPIPGAGRLSGPEPGLQKVIDPVLERPDGHAPRDAVKHTVHARAVEQGFGKVVKVGPALNEAVKGFDHAHVGADAV